MPQTAKIGFIDFETTGLVPGLHKPWDHGLIIRHPNGREEWHNYLTRPGARAMRAADPEALAVGDYQTRTAICLPMRRNEVFNLANEYVGRPRFSDPSLLAARFANLLDGAILVCINAGFDPPMLAAWMREHGQVPTWDYHPECAATIAVHRLRLTGRDVPTRWKTNDVAAMLGVNRYPATAHNALPDADFARRLYDAGTAPLTPAT